MTTDRAMSLVRTLNDNIGWIRHICYTLHQISKNGLYLKPFILTPYLSDLPNTSSGITIPYRPNIVLSCSTSEHGNMKCKFSRGANDKVTLTFTQSGVEVEDKDKSGVVSDFLVRLATDRDVFREILENYYNIARAAIIIAQNSGGEEYKPEHIDNIYSIMSMVEDAYINTYGESITADEGTISKLVRWCEWERSIGYKIQNLVGQMESTPAIDEAFRYRLRYSDYIRIDDDKSIYIDIKLARYKIRLFMHAFDRKVDILNLLIDTDMVKRNIDIAIQIRCFNCLDDALSSLAYADKLVDCITDLCRSLKQKTYKGLWVCGLHIK